MGTSSVVKKIASSIYGDHPEEWPDEEYIRQANEVVSRLAYEGLSVIDTTDEAMVQLVAEALARDGSNQFVEISGHGKAWGDIDPKIKYLAIESQVRTARAVLTAVGQRAFELRQQTLQRKQEDK